MVDFILSELVLQASKLLLIGRVLEKKNNLAQINQPNN